MATNDSQKRVVQANFSQGDVYLSNESRGKQCMTNCVVFIMQSCLKSFEDIDRNDLNFTLVKGDILYKKMCQYGFLRPNQELLQFSDLPKFVNFKCVSFSIETLLTFYGNMSVNGSVDGVGKKLETSLNSVLSSSCSKQFAILIFHSSAVAITFNERWHIWSI